MLTLRIVAGLISAATVLFLPPTLCRAQTGVPGTTAAMASPGATTVVDGRWEITIDGRIGFPHGHLRVGEFPTTAPKVGGTPGTTLGLKTLGVDVSEAVEGSAAFHLTPRDAVRATYLYYFLDGSTTLRGPSVVYNGQEFTTGRLTTNADFYRISLDYERVLVMRPSGERVVGTLGLTYVQFNPTLTGRSSEGGAESRGASNSEDFYRQALPVPIVGARWDHPIADKWWLRAALSGGGLPRVDSGRKEGGVVYFEERHADVGLSVVYMLGRHAEIEAGYHFTYFFQREISHEDRNVFELFDNGVHARIGFRF